MNSSESVRQEGVCPSMSTSQLAYKTELDLNDRQVTACNQHAGAARYAYNWSVRRKQEAYEATGTSPSAIDLHRELNAAINLAKLAKLAGSSRESRNTCGAESAGQRREALMKLSAQAGPRA